MSSLSHSNSANTPAVAKEGGNPPLLRMRGICKSFSGIPALVDVDLDLHSGKVHALLGQNGAGKSTLISILSGALQQDKGEIEIDGEHVDFANPSEALKGGVVAVYQELSLLPDMTVAENLFLGIEPGRGPVINRAEMADRAREVLSVLGASDIDPGKPVGDLSIASQQLVEVAKALTREARVVILDEPSAVLSANELTLLYSMIKRMTDNGIAIVYITHRLDEVMEIADEVTVMRDGCKVLEESRSELSQQDMIRAMVGREVILDAPAKWQVGVSAGGTGPALRLQGVSLPGMKDHTLDFAVQSGEIVGIAGLTGSGRSRILRVLAGLEQPLSGSILLGDQKLNLRSPKAAIAHGIVLVPEDRKRLGLVLNLSVAANITLSVLRRLARFGWVRSAQVKSQSQTMVSQLQIKVASTQQEVRFLSGGNQQKVVLARCISVHPGVLLLDEPLRGVDVGAKAEIIDIVGAIAEQGTAVIVVSSEVEDVLALTNRVLVLRDGIVVRELLGTEATESEVLAASAGSHA